MTQTLPVPVRLTLCLFLLATGCGHTRPEQDAATLRQLVSDQAAAWNRQDATAWSRDFAPDADFINIVGSVFQGHDEIEKRHAAIFATIFKGSQTRVTVRRLVFLTPDVALVDTVHEVTGYQGLPPGVQDTEPGLLRTQMRYVMKRIDGQWRISAGQNTDVKPAPPPR